MNQANANVMTINCNSSSIKFAPFDPEQLPEEIQLTKAFYHHFPNLAQMACFNATFHHNLPRLAQQLPIPHCLKAQGVRRYLFHGLSYTFLLEELAQAANARVIFAHFGNGADLAAVFEGKPMDTSEGISPQDSITTLGAIS